MGLVKGGALRLLQTALYALLFLCAAIILGIYSYFLSVLADRNLSIATWEKAVEGLSGAATLYLIFATILTCCLGGISFFAFLAIVLDVLFAGAMIAIAIMTRHGADSCRGYVRTPLGDGQSSLKNGFGGSTNSNNRNVTYSVTLGTACKLNTAAFAVSIIGALFFLVTAALQVALIRHHKKEKRYGPSPSNNYTSGYGKRKFWQRKNKNTAAKDTELGTVGGGLAAPAAAHDTRPSHETGYTGTTVGGTGNAYDKTEAYPHTTHGGYHTQPQGTGVNPYGYDNSVPPTHSTGTATNY